MKILFCIRDDGDMTEPMNIMMLSALARRAGHFVSLWVIERDDPKEVIRKEKPDIAAFSCITGSHKFYIEAARTIKKINPKIKTIFGGPHFTFFPGEVLKSVGEIDIVCVGEGYDAWPETLSALEAGSPVELIKNIITPYNAKDVLELEPLNGLVQLNAGEDKSVSPDRYTISKSHLRPQRINLDELPLMDRELIYNNTDFKHRYKRTMMASYGCPFRCAYCFEHQFSLLYKGLGKPRRWYGVDRFLEELEYVKKNWDTRFFKFYDDVMIPFPNDIEIAWHEEFCRKYPSKIGLPFHLLTRCDLVVSLKERKEVDVLSDWKK
ncbi:MAG: cobalamin-dependent protein, partial [bacterium]|nr:cobalamin-dependent protein [bacterium]